MSETATIQDVYQEVLDIKKQMISKEELARVLETAEILGNSKTMHQLRASEQDITAHKTKKVSSVKDLIVELA